MCFGFGYSGEGLAEKIKRLYTTMATSTHSVQRPEDCIHLVLLLWVGLASRRPALVLVAFVFPTSVGGVHRIIACPLAPRRRLNRAAVFCSCSTGPKTRRNDRREPTYHLGVTCRVASRCFVSSTTLPTNTVPDKSGFVRLYSVVLSSICSS